MATKKEAKKDTKKSDNSTKKNTAVNTKKSTKKNEEKKVISTEKSNKVASKKTTTKTKTSSEVTTSRVKKEASKSKKDALSSKSKVGAKKASTSKAKNTKSTKKSEASKKTSSKVTRTKKEVKSSANPMLAEYYDLPYRYNETTVKILAQTPTTLFVYWDISDDDRNNLINKLGENFFYETKPILIVHNLTKNYSFEIEINDFANSWYIRTQEPNCDYVIELGRKDFSKPQEYVHIYSSNDIVSPNDHILFENSDLGNVLFRNVKTNVLSSKDFGSLRFINDIDKLYGNLYDVYSRLYKDETLNELGNPSSGEFIMK